MTMPIKRPPAKRALCSTCKRKVLKERVIANPFDGQPICDECTVDPAFHKKQAVRNRRYNRNRREYNPFEQLQRWHDYEWVLRQNNQD